MYQKQDRGDQIEFNTLLKIMCLRDYIREHPSHDKFSTKKHVLVCSKRKNQEENKHIFEMYQLKCILKQKHIQVPEFSKEVKLSSRLNQINALPQLPT